jgi:pentatricopeptide repeat protein
MTNALCKERKLQKANNLLDEMEIKGFSLEIVTYNTLMVVASMVYWARHSTS